MITDYDVRLSSNKQSLLLLFLVNSQPILKELSEIEIKLTAQSYADSFKYSKIINIKCVGNWNKVIISKKRKCEGFNANYEFPSGTRNAQITDKIAEKVTKNNIKFIRIAGPSARGKTTFNKKLDILLWVQGIQTIVISMDDYFKNRKDILKDKKGNYDFEC